MLFYVSLEFPNVYTHTRGRAREGNLYVCACACVFFKLDDIKLRYLIKNIYVKFNVLILTNFI